MWHSARNARETCAVFSAASHARSLCRSFQTHLILVELYLMFDRGDWLFVVGGPFWRSNLAVHAFHAPPWKYQIAVVTRPMQPSCIQSCSYPARSTLTSYITHTTLLQKSRRQLQHHTARLVLQKACCGFCFSPLLSSARCKR